MFMGFKLNFYDVFIMFPNVGYSDPGIYFHCPHKNYGILKIEMVGAVTHEDVKSWEACSQKCQEMEGCKYWTWQRANKVYYLPYKCWTMTDATGKIANSNHVSGRRDCL